MKHLCELVRHEFLLFGAVQVRVLALGLLRLLVLLLLPLALPPHRLLLRLLPLLVLQLLQLGR